jgi:hypothetical protein
VKKILLIFILFIYAEASLFAASPEKYGSDVDPYRLAFATLMENDSEMIDKLIDSEADWSPFQKAILGINRILITDKLSGLKVAVKNLDLVASGNKDSVLYKIYRGMGEAFLARKWTIFGVKYLENAEEYMTSIPENYDDWFIRLLRGMSYYNLGQGLPGIWPMKEKKELALKLGENDLKYVIQEYSKNSTEYFRMENYDWSSLPVPDKAAGFAEKALNDD